MRIWIAIALAACSYKDQEQLPPSGSTVVPQAAVAPENMPILQAQVAGSAGIAMPAPGDASVPAAPLRGIPLQVTLDQCAKPKLDDCGLAAVPRNPFTTIGLQNCPIATGLELRDASGAGLMRCGLVIRNGSAVSIVDTMIVCKNWDDAGQALPRTRAIGATCTGDQLDIDLETKDAKRVTKLRVACRVADHGFACAREPDLEAGNAAVSRALADVTRVIEAHQWRALLDMCDPDQRRTQLKLGQDEPTYLAEMIGLHYVGNSLGTDDGGITFDELSTITKLQPLEIAHQGNGNYAVLGFVTLKNGTRLRFDIRLQRSGTRFVLSGAVG